MNENKEVESGFARWDWYALRSKLAGDNFLSLEQVDNHNWIAALNHLSYLKERDQFIENIKRQQRQKN